MTLASVLKGKMRQSKLKQLHTVLADRECWTVPGSDFGENLRFEILKKIRIIFKCWSVIFKKKIYCIKGSYVVNVSIINNKKSRSGSWGTKMRKRTKRESVRVRIFDNVYNTVLGNPQKTFSFSGSATNRGGEGKGLATKKK